MKACIFDLDGVLVDTAKYHFLAWKRLAAELGITLTEQQNEQLKGVGRMESLNIILHLGGVVMDDVQKQRLTERKNAWLVEYIEAMEPEEILDGASELLDALRKNNVKIGLASSSKNARTVLGKLHLTDAFDAVVDGTMITHTKPHPEIFLRAAELLRLSPEDCVVIEDAQAGIDAASKAGMKCVGIGDAEHLRGADLLCNTLAEVTIEKLFALGS